MMRDDFSKNGHRAFASANDVRRVFQEHRAELEWLAYFITGDHAIAAACITDACASSELHMNVFPEWLVSWARHATIRSAINTQHDRIKQASTKYEHASLLHRRHEPLTGEMLEVVVQHSDLLIARLDVVSRTTLVICGVQKNSVADAALLLGVSRAVASTAYCVALDSLEVIRCEHAVHENGSAVLWN